MDPPVQVDFNGKALYIYICMISPSLFLSPSSPPPPFPPLSHPPQITLVFYIILTPHPLHTYVILFIISGYTIHSTPVPSGGPLLLFLLNVMDEYHLSPSSNINLTYHRLVEAFKYGFALRTLFGDPNCEECGDVKDEIMDTQINMTRYIL